MKLIIFARMCHLNSYFVLIAKPLKVVVFISVYDITLFIIVVNIL